jgi:hypothetical protein
LKLKLSAFSPEKQEESSTKTQKTQKVRQKHRVGKEFESKDRRDIIKDVLNSAGTKAFS